ncbi:hypothetical protein FACS1894130_13090 [Spirochaetia bacterium]|nr:hypothetical protein FACS1894130_13090 [Spirochaetia bacterium]
MGTSDDRPYNRGNYLDIMVTGNYNGNTLIYVTNRYDTYVDFRGEIGDLWQDG